MNLDMKKSIFLLLILTCLLESCYVYHSADVKKDGQKPSVQEQIKPEQIYKIETDNKIYKIKAVKWENDSLVAQINEKKDIKKKFSVNQITNVKERKFSNSRSDILTVLSYIAIGTGIVFLVNKF